MKRKNYSLDSIIMALDKLSAFFFLLSSTGEILYCNFNAKNKFPQLNKVDPINISVIFSAYYSDLSHSLDFIYSLKEGVFVLKKNNLHCDAIEWQLSKISINNALYNVLIGYDVTKYERLKKKVLHTESHLQSVIDSIAGNHWWKDLDGIYRGYNQSLLDTLGLESFSQVIGKTDYELPWKNQADKLTENDNIIISTGKSLQFEEDVLTSTGEKKAFVVTKVPFKDVDGKIIGTIGTSVDITKQKELARNLLESKEKAEAGSRAKSQFIANMSHDIRTPITGIVGMIQSLLYACEELHSVLLSETQSTSFKHVELLRDFIVQTKNNSNMVLNSVDELLKLCNEILEVTRLDSIKPAENLESFNLRKLIRHNIDLLKPVAQHKKLSLFYDVNESVPTYLCGLRCYLDRTLLNLISNALKFTDNGFVKVKVKLLGDSNADYQTGDNVTIQIFVQDSGIGIPKDKFDTIFECFSRLTPAYEGVYKGAGLGLYTVNRYIKMMNGKIDIESEVGKGTCFILTLPFTVSDSTDQIKEKIYLSKTFKSNFVLPITASKIEKPVTKKEGRPSILVVEDNAMVATAVTSTLKPFKCEIDIAESGAQAVKMAQNGSYDLILMDIGLPDFNGIEAANKIRTLDDPKKSQVPIVALTGHASDPEKRQESLDAGMQDVICKPAPPLALKSLLQEYVFKSAIEKVPTYDKDSELMPIIDWNACVRMCHNDSDLTHELLIALTEDLKITKNKLVKFYNEQNSQSLCAELHRILGGVSYLKLPQLEKALKLFQQSVKAKPQNFIQLEKTFVKLQQAMNHTYKWLIENITKSCQLESQGVTET